eukprot:g555.t1
MIDETPRPPLKSEEKSADLSSTTSSYSYDRPLFVQFCGNDPKIMLAAGKLIEDYADAFDINLGCPQGIARKGNYGSFLLEQVDLLKDIVSTLHNGLSIPVTCKIRILPSFEDTLNLCLALQDSGCQVLTIHGRTKEQNKQFIDTCNWDWIRKIKAHPSIRIPIVANGGIATNADIEKCLKFTNVDAVMTSEAILENPALFIQPKTEKWYETYHERAFRQHALALEYLDICGQHLDREKEWMQCVKPHLFKFLSTSFSDPKNHQLRGKLGKNEKSFYQRDILEKIQYWRDIVYALDADAKCSRGIQSLAIENIGEARTEAENLRLRQDHMIDIHEHYVKLEKRGPMIMQGGRRDDVVFSSSSADGEKGAEKKDEEQEAKGHTSSVNEHDLPRNGKKTAIAPTGGGVINPNIFSSPNSGLWYVRHQVKMQDPSWRKKQFKKKKKDQAKSKTPRYDCDTDELKKKEVCNKEKDVVAAQKRKQEERAANDLKELLKKQKV